MDFNKKDKTDKTKLHPTGLSLSGEEETGCYYCPVDKDGNVITEKKKYIKAGESAPSGWIQCE